MKIPELKPCPFCGRTPELPDGDGSEYLIECVCGLARSGVFIVDCMNFEDRDMGKFDFETGRYPQQFIDKAALVAIENWNTRMEQTA